MVPARSIVTNQGPARTRPSALDLSTTAEYHHSLRDHGREGGRDLEGQNQQQQQQQSRDRAASKFTTRRWMPIRPKTSDASTRPTTKSSSRRDASKRDTVLNPSLQLSRQEVEEFETLPIAVRRKYFSTLERLRFAQTSSVLVQDNPRPSDLYTHSPRSFTFSNDRALQSTNNLKQPNLVAPPIYQTQPVSTDCLPLNSTQHRLTRAEQVALAKSLRESVILDAADEAIYKIGRRASRHLSPQTHLPAISSTRPSMEAPTSRPADVKVQERRPGLDAFYDSVRFLDGDEDLDLTLQLDDYHANLKEELPMPSHIINNNDNTKGPSFRRHLSINKIPFGRASFSTNRAPHNNVLSPPTSPTTPAVATLPQQPRRKSRALSLINTRHVAAQEPTATAIDPAAAHYRDPEARAKLRVYLASPQKFDEAVEFGFPSGDGLTSQPTQGESPSARGGSRDLNTRDSSEFKTFFSDDRSSIYSDEMSLPDPESPRTPSSPAKTGLRSDSVAGGESTQSRKPSDGYALLPAASREMTLRMTLTRSDLRDCEDQMYGWRKGSVEPANKPSSRLPSLEDLPPPKAAFSGDNGKPKESLEAFFAALDEEEAAEAAAAATTDSGVVKRFWKKMRRAT